MPDYGMTSAELVAAVQGSVGGMAGVTLKNLPPGPDGLQEVVVYVYGKEVCTVDNTGSAQQIVLVDLEATKTLINEQPVPVTPPAPPPPPAVEPTAVGMTPNELIAAVTSAFQGVPGVSLVPLPHEAGGVQRINVFVNGKDIGEVNNLGSSNDILTKDIPGAVAWATVPAAPPPPPKDVPGQVDMFGLGMTAEELDAAVRDAFAGETDVAIVPKPKLRTGKQEIEVYVRGSSDGVIVDNTGSREQILTQDIPNAIKAIEASRKSYATPKPAAVSAKPTVTTPKANPPTGVTVAPSAGVTSVKSAGLAYAAAIPKLTLDPFSEGGQLLRSAMSHAKIFRARTGTQFSNDWGQEAPTYIEVVQLPTNPQNTADLRKIEALGMKYNDFFITDTQETDAEKAEVSETFGAPHVFTSGRYMRKVTVSGVCRTGAVNPGLMDSAPSDEQAAIALMVMTDQDKARYVVPHTVGLRVLYDSVLRASEQASRGLFSRLVVDGEVYCGWFTTLNIARNSEHEGFAQFTMSMLVFARYHPREKEAGDLLSTGTLPAKKAFDDASATATLASRAGIMTLSVSPGSASVKGTVSESTSGALVFNTATSLTAGGQLQSVTVWVTYLGFPIRGFNLLFGQNSNSLSILNESVPSKGGNDLKPSITDFESFIRSIDAAEKAFDPGSEPSVKRKPINLTVNIKPSMAEADKTVELVVNMDLDTVQTPKISDLFVRLGITDEDLKLPVVKPANDVFQAPATSTVRVRFTLTSAGGSPMALTPEQIAGTVVKILDPETKAERTNAAGPLVEAKVGIVLGAVEQADKNAAAKSGAATVTGTPVLSAIGPETGLTELSLVFGYSQIAAGGDLRTVNPFVSAKDLVTSFRFKLSIPGASDATSDVVSIDAQYPKSWVADLIQSITRAGATIGGFGNDIVALDFKLRPAAAEQVTRNKEAVEQAINAIVAASTFEFDGSWYALGKLNTAKVYELSTTTASVLVPGFSIDNLNPVTANSVTGASRTVSMKPPNGIRSIFPLIVRDE